MWLLELVTRGLLAARADTCRYIQAHSGDGCWHLAQSCGISQDDLEKYNPVSDFCNSITVDQYVCCSEGDLPDFSPQQNQDGSCFAYMVQTNDTCAAIAKANQMETDKISKVNNDTWGWGGCQHLHARQKICLSYGTPPFPAPVAGTVCGPQVSLVSLSTPPPPHNFPKVDERAVANYCGCRRCQGRSSPQT